MEKNNPHFVNFALRCAGLTQADIASRLDRKVNTVCAVVNGRGRSRRIEAIISLMTGVPLHELWPKWYDADGRRISRRRRSIDQAVRQFERAQAMLQRAA